MSMNKNHLSTHEKFLLIIPARGGSKGIPRKNMRSLNGEPLIQYVIDLALSLELEYIDICLSTDDREIMQRGFQNKVIVHDRSSKLSDDNATLDEVVIDATSFCESKKGINYNFVITIQPTSPFLKASTIYNCLKELSQSNAQTVLTTREEKHLSWGLDDGEFFPNYEKRVNRQWLPPSYVETGGCVACERDILNRGSRFGEIVKIVNVGFPESIDIDTAADWALAEHVLNRKRIAIWVVGSSKLGLGHVANMLIIASELASHNIKFFCEPSQTLAITKIRANNYPITINQDPLSAIENWSPDIIINDRLDTTLLEIRRQKKIGACVINFEDLGPGAYAADYVFNAIYEMQSTSSHILFGFDYYLLRDEFMFANKAPEAKKDIKNVVITFGGTDPNNLTEKVLEAISDFSHENKIKITVILGLGAKELEKKYLSEKFEIVRDTKRISYYLSKADVAFSSAGRTIYELASLQVPSIILCQNERELTHVFATKEFGFLNLGLGSILGPDEILFALKSLINNVKIRKDMKSKMASHNLSSGRKRVAAVIKTVCSESIHI